ncbi:MAG: PAS domain-containing protein [Bdellovibrionaceae bacterium]|nr:PAS domain-containing protein [Pseudobdellovibrionaceae bacterium]
MINSPPSDSELMRLLDRVHREARMSGWSLSLAKDAFRWSAGMSELVGVPSEAHPTVAEFMSYLEPAAARAFAEAVESCLKDGASFHLTVRTARVPHCLAIWGLREKDEDGEPCVYGLCQDITAQMRQEQELLETRTRLQNILDEVPAVIYSKTKEGYFQFANPLFYEVVPTGGRASVTGMHSNDILPEETSREHIANDLEVVRTGKTLHSIEHVPQADGTVRYFDSYKFPTRNARGEITGITGVSVDITEKKRMQDDLDRQRALALHQSRLASIGELAAGVGHEINNPLTIVMSYLSQIEENLSEPAIGTVTRQRNLEMISKARKASERIRSIVGGLRTFARASADAKQAFPVLRAVANSVNMVKEIYAKDGVDLEFKPCDGQPACHGDEGQIQQVVMNLLSNARDAVLPMKLRQIHVAVERKDQHVLIVVRDSGPGIEPVHLARIFDPFFTTKEMTKGTGLGLPIAHSIVKDHGGDIHYTRRPEGGSEFTVTLPLHLKNIEVTDTAVAVAPAPAPAVRPKGLARILVADDEIDIQEILCMVLEQIGFDVDSVGTGKDALARITTGEYDALITDMNMPAPKGGELIRLIREEHGNQRLKIFIITGGITGNLGSEDAKLQGMIDGHFFKPFDQHILKSSLFSALGL